ncbi:MAG: hypothetical protein ACHP7H_01265 [Hyphomicrobiales bacterium]
MLAIASVAATSASALPEWGQCVAKAGGKYSESNCLTKAKPGKGTFEFNKGTASIANKKFSGEGGTGILTGEYKICQGGKNQEQRVPKCAEGETEETFFGGPLNIECTSEANHGEVHGTKEVVGISVVFRGCKVLGSVPCSNSEKEGEIRVNTLKGSLGYISKGTKDVGVLLEPIVKKGAFAEFGCLGGLLTTVVGVGNSKEGAAYSPETTGGFDGIISPVTPVNEMNTKLTQVYTVNANEENVPSHFEGKHNELLESYIFNAEEPSGHSTKWSKAGESITNVNTSEEAMEIKA